MINTNINNWKIKFRLIRVYISKDLSIENGPRHDIRLT